MLNFHALKLFILLLLMLVVDQSFGQSTGQITGKITDSDGKVVFLADVVVLNHNIGTSSNSFGEFKLYSPIGKVNLKVSFLGYKSFDTTFTLSAAIPVKLNITLIKDIKVVEEVSVTGRLTQAGNLERIDLISVENMPSTTGNIEDVVKTFTGVSSNNELSSQYSVRGGSYDENLIYVNDIEIYRPFLIRSGQQEGLSFVNPDLVSSLQFSAGGFNAEYGDKLSSVLDIKYKRPSEFEGKASASLLGGSVSIGSASKNKKFTQVTGFRYKTSQYLLSSLETEGDYNPNFYDFQTFMTYDITDKLEFSALGNISINQYQFRPAFGYTEFGTLENALAMAIYYEGQEIDQLLSGLGGAYLNYNPTKKTSIKLSSSYFKTSEQVTYDIQGAYSLNALDNTFGSGTAGDSIDTYGSGIFLKHARNYLDANIFNSELKFTYYANENNSFKVGFKYQHETISDDISEWDYLDSVDYSSPFDDENLELRNSLKKYNTLNSHRYNFYVQYSYNFTNIGPFEGIATFGVRSSYWDINEDVTISPRFNVNFSPIGNNNIVYHLAYGLYYQPPLYKEIRNLDGNLLTETKAQKSYQYIAGFDYYFNLTGRPFKFATEFYYKDIVRLIPYKVENVDIQYLPEYEAYGYTAGVDFKLNGEFLPGTESWLSLSFMQSKEDIIGDSYINSDFKHIRPGFYSRPNSQFVNFSMYFQDYLPSNPEIKFNFTLHFGSRLPANPPNYSKPSIIFELPTYKRIDVGLSKMLKSKKRQSFIPGCKETWISAEIFNLFGFENTISYQWIKTVNNREGISNTFAIPTSLTSRRVNIKLTAKF